LSFERNDSPDGDGVRYGEPVTATHSLVSCGELGISEITVKAHRGRVMRKMKAGSLADLVNMAARLHLS
jgi:hypothetical protein